MSTQKICLECDNIVDANSGLDICTYCLTGEYEDKEPTMLEKYKAGIFKDKDNIEIAGYKGIGLIIQRGEYKEKNTLSLVAEYYNNNGNICIFSIDLTEVEINEALIQIKKSLKEKLNGEQFN